MSKKFKLAAFDFDYTLLNANSNNLLNKLVMERESGEFAKQPSLTPSIAQLNRFKYSNEIENLGIKFRDNNTIRINAIYEYMHKKYGINREDMEKCLRNLATISETMRKLISHLKHLHYDLIIISDSNSFLIETILKQNNMLHFFVNENASHHDTKIFANKAYFDKNGCLRVKPFQDEETRKCSIEFCKANICKGEIITHYIDRRNAHGYELDTAIYVGDGRIDFCPGTKLTSNCLFFVRDNLSLCKLLREKAYSDNIKAEIKFWKNGADIMNQILK
jgi:pyridoxal phosphate phosphatase PHOSPHO2